MNTIYVNMSVKTQKQLLCLLELVILVDPIYYSTGIAPVSHYFTDGSYHEDKEIILNNRFTLNPSLVSFSLGDKLGDLNFNDPDLKFNQPLLRGGHKNLQVSAKNYRDGVDALFPKAYFSCMFYLET